MAAPRSLPVAFCDFGYHKSGLFKSLKKRTVVVRLPFIALYERFGDRPTAPPPDFRPESIFFIIFFFFAVSREVD